MGKPLIGCASLLVVLAFGASPAWAGWGCAWSAPELKGNPGRIWSADTQAEAREASLRQCSRSFKGCYIIACRANVDTKEEADALWPMKGPPRSTCGPPPKEPC